VAGRLAPVAQTAMEVSIGWVHAGVGRGLFVRHTDPSRENVVDTIQTSLKNMAARRKEKFGPLSQSGATRRR
jgi:hypothetical protein